MLVKQSEAFRPAQGSMHLSELTSLLVYFWCMIQLQGADCPESVTSSAACSLSACSRSSFCSLLFLQEHITCKNYAGLPTIVVAGCPHQTPSFVPLVQDLRHVQACNGLHLRDAP